MVWMKLSEDLVNKWDKIAYQQSQIKMWDIASNILNLQEQWNPGFQLIIPDDVKESMGGKPQDKIKCEGLHMWSKYHLVIHQEYPESFYL